jgi:uncharacterized protein (DUF934 family)
MWFNGMADPERREAGQIGVAWAPVAQVRKLLDDLER